MEYTAREGCCEQGRGKREKMAQNDVEDIVLVGTLERLRVVEGIGKHRPELPDETGVAGVVEGR